MVDTEIVVIGGGIAGLSAAAALATKAKVIVLEQEDVMGFHASGRSATYYHCGISNHPVRALTAFSRPFFESPPVDFADGPLCTPKPALFIARANMLQALDALYDEMTKVTDTALRVDEGGMRALLPVLRFGPEHVVAGVVDYGGRRLDADRLLQGFARQVKRSGGKTVNGARVTRLQPIRSGWSVETANETYTAKVVVNAAGAWADVIAGLAGIAPLGLQPLRRTVILFDGPDGVETRDWPFVKMAVDEFYMIPESGRLLASPVDEIPSGPMDAQAEEYDLAFAAYRVEENTTLSVKRIAHRWAGLRSFLPDRVPAAGFDPDATGFFWLAGQGGYGLQTSPAMADVARSLITGEEWPKSLSRLGVSADTLSPARFR